MKIKFKHQEKINSSEPQTQCPTMIELQENQKNLQTTKIISSRKIQYKTLSASSRNSTIFNAGTVIFLRSFTHHLQHADFR